VFAQTVVSGYKDLSTEIFRTANHSTYSKKINDTETQSHRAQ